ncbi:hypothetical protein [uncultured Microbacterium sp.]|uniref:hypothetical protein n=1 Tax=uncultured Microbacterium sp. TaxID=191216 RepID=UPI0025E80CED|nr:hypothetical protein [uncultured Microbacterium sp.]
MSAIAGAIVVRERAVAAVVRAVAAEALGVPAQRTRVRLADDGGLIGVDLTSAVAASSGGPSVLARVASAREAVHELGSHLSGARIGRVRVDVDDVVVPTRRVS